MTTNHLAAVAVFAQVDSLGAKFTGLAAQVVAALLGLAVAWATVILLWRLLEAMIHNPSAQKLLGIVGVLLFAIFLVGAAPDMADAAYNYGQSFMDAEAGR